MKTKLWCVVITWITVTAIAANTRAEYGVNVTGNGNTTSGDWTLGYQFTVGSQPIQVNALGYFDDSENGFTSTHQVGIWNLNGTLLSSAVVNNNSAVDDFFRWTPVNPISLAANTTYKVAGTTGSDFYSWENPGFTVGAGITFNRDVYKPGGFGFPTDSEGRSAINPGIFGGNFSYTVVPEASTLTLAIVGLLGIGRLRKRR